MWTESEAKTKLCPFIRRAMSIPGVVTKDDPQMCVASECMAWRWEMTRKPLTKDQIRDAGMARGLAYALQPVTFEHGFCGASGQTSGRPSIAPSDAENAA